MKSSTKIRDTRYKAIFQGFDKFKIWDSYDKKYLSHDPFKTKFDCEKFIDNMLEK